MNETSNTPIKDCDNHYSEQELFDIFGMTDSEVKICLKCKNHRMEDGIITCKYILEGLEDN